MHCSPSNAHWNPNEVQTLCYDSHGMQQESVIERYLLALTNVDLRTLA